jgi:hypothetical protein
MESWMNRHLSTIKSPVHDTLNLRWNSKDMIRDANLLTRLSHAPNCLDATPNGMAHWRDVRLNETQFEVWVVDSVGVHIEWESGGTISKDGLKVLGADFVVKRRGMVEVHGNTFRDALALYMVSRELEDGDRGILSLVPMFLQIRSLSDEQLDRLFNDKASDTLNTNSAVNTTVRDDIPKIENNVSSPVAKTIVPVSAFHEMTTSRCIPPPSSGVLPTLLGCHPFAKTISAPPQKHLMMIHTPESIGQPVLH